MALPKCIRSALHDLRRDAPIDTAPIKVFVRQRLEKDTWGTCELRDDSKGKRFIISIRKAADLFMQVNLIHEWAHARVWRDGEFDQDHDAAWGMEFAKLYRIVFDD